MLESTGATSCRQHAPECTVARLQAISAQAISHIELPAFCRWHSLDSACRIIHRYLKCIGSWHCCHWLGILLLGVSSPAVCLLVCHTIRHKVVQRLLLGLPLQEECFVSFPREALRNCLLSTSNIASTNLSFWSSGRESIAHCFASAHTRTLCWRNDSEMAAQTPGPSISYRP